MAHNAHRDRSRTEYARQTTLSRRAKRTTKYAYAPLDTARLTAELAANKGSVR